MNQTRLSPVDHIFTGRGAYPISFVFFYDQILDKFRLQQAFKKVVEDFWPLRSQLQFQDGSYYLRSKDEPIEIVEKNFSQKFDTDAFEDLPHLCPLVESVEGSPLIRIQLNRIPNGSALGVSISHAVVDGYSYFMFLREWAKTARNSEAFACRTISRTNLPFNLQCDRSVLIPNTIKSERLSPGSFQAATGFVWSAVSRSEQVKTRWVLESYSQNRIREIYQEASAQVDVRLSINDVLVADLCRKFFNSLASSGTLKQANAYDYRRICSRLTPLYFGNAIRGATLRLSEEDVLEMALGHLANRVRKAISEISEEDVLSSLEAFERLRAHEGLPACQNVHVADPDGGFLVTNLSRLPMKELDFGFGPPACFRIVTPAPSTAVVMPGKTEKSLEVLVCLK